MPGGGNLGDHGERAIGNAQMGMRQHDVALRVGIFVWAIVGLGGFVIAQMVFEAAGGISLRAVALIVVGAGCVGVLVATVLGRHTARKREAEAAEIRALDAAEKARQMDAFKKSKPVTALDARR